jgi:cholesterol oxidase
MSFDVIVIGSGFGGAITGCRLAEKGYKVLILERGRRWDKTTYPRTPEDPWLWSHSHPERYHGWLDLRIFPNMSVIQGAAVGGGSLIYANVSVEAPAKVFDSGWPKEFRNNELKPHYDAVGSFMNVKKLPDNQWNPRTRLMWEAAQKIGAESRFKMLDLAVSFDPDLKLDPDHPPIEADSKTFTNAQGVQQGTCYHSGFCDIGCPVYAKNTLDKNYIPWAEKHGAEVRSLHLVTNVEPVTGGYRVSFDRLEKGGRIPGNETARIVIVAAGSLGSTELLLRCRDLTGSLPNLSPFLGRNWSSNGDFLTPALYTGHKREPFPALGPTIASAIDFLDGSDKGQTYWIEDGGFPHLLGAFYSQGPARAIKALAPDALIGAINKMLRAKDPANDIMPWFAQGLDAGDGVLSLKRPWWFFGERRLHLAWDVTRSVPVFNAIVDMHKRLSRETGGIPIPSLPWELSKDLITPHPLGGCGMADTPAKGVVDHRGEVFGHKNLYVADGAILPTPVGVNPSRTIGALAERIAKIIADEGR